MLYLGPPSARDNICSHPRCNAARQYSKGWNKIFSNGFHEEMCSPSRSYICMHVHVLWEWLWEMYDCFVLLLCPSLLGQMQRLWRQQHFTCPCANSSYPHERENTSAAHTSHVNSSEILADGLNINWNLYFYLFTLWSNSWGLRLKPTVSEKFSCDV